MQMTEQITLGKYIEETRRLRGYSQRKLALTSGLSNTTISRLENNLIENPEVETLRKIEEALKLLDNQLVTMAYPALAAPIDQSNSPTEQLQRIPVYSSLRPEEPIFVQEEIIDYEYMSKDLECSEDCFYLEVTGDWMTKSRLYKGDRVLIKALKQYHSGDVVVVRNKNKVVSIKKMITTDTAIIFQPESFNPQHEPEIYPKQDLEKGKIKILGKVIYAKIKI